MKNNPKLSIFLVIYSIICMPFLYDIFFSRNGLDTFGATLLLFGLATVVGVCLAGMALFSKANRRNYVLGLCIVLFPLLLIWLKELRLFQHSSPVEIELIELKEPPSR
jgi:predicted MFS family arabinose efflux permease